MQNWGTNVNIPAPHGAGTRPQPLHRIKYNPLGLYDLRRHCGALPNLPGAYDNHRLSFEAADLAWIATSLSLSTNSLQLAPYQFPPEFQTLRDGMPTGTAATRAAMRTRLQKLIFDLASLLDRAYGGVTLVLHVEESNRPNSPLQPEFVKADVHFPGYLIDEDPRLSPILSRMVQQFIVEIGLPVVDRWGRCARAMWPMTQGANGRVPLPYAEQVEQPVAIPHGSSSFLYHGRRINLDTSAPRRDNSDNQTSTPRRDNNNSQTSTPRHDDDDNQFEQFEPSASEWQAIEAVERYAHLEYELAAVRAELVETKKALSEALARECDHAAQLEAARSHLSTLADGSGGRHTVSFALQPSPSAHASPNSGPLIHQEKHFFPKILPGHPRTP